jgi:drug/metabolite transporter (DMT)-like permease
MCNNNNNLQQNFKTYVLVSLNIIAAVSIIILNKVLFRSWANTAALTLSHSVATKVTTSAMRACGIFESKTLPQLSVGKVALFGIMSVVLMNINLSLNSIGVYQASKILVLPATSVLESIFYSVAQRNVIWASLGLITFGAFLSSPTEVLTSFSSTSSVSFGGLSAAMVAVIVAAGTVILIGRTQRELDTSPLNLLDQQQFYVILYALAMSGAYEGASPWNQSQLTPEVLALIAGTSCMAAILNASGFFVIKSLSPLTYQVTSHLKTILTLILGTLLFGEVMTVRQICGFFVCLIGIAAYTFIKDHEVCSAASISAITCKSTEELGGENIS